MVRCVHDTSPSRACRIACVTVAFYLVSRFTQGMQLQNTGCISSCIAAYASKPVAASVPLLQNFILLYTTAPFFLHACTY